MVDASQDDQDVEVGHFSVAVKEILESGGSEMERFFPLDGQKDKCVSVHLLVQVRVVFLTCFDDL